jgi:hypothetical protein
MLVGEEELEGEEEKERRNGDLVREREIWADKGKVLGLGSVRRARTPAMANNGQSGRGERGEKGNGGNDIKRRRGRIIKGRLWVYRKGNMVFDWENTSCVD